MKQLHKVFAVFLVFVLGPVLIWMYTVFEPKLEFSFTTSTLTRANSSNPRVILAWNGFFGRPLWFWEETNKGKSFVKQQCDNYECILTTNKTMLKQSNMVLFHLRDRIKLPLYRNKTQDWVLAIWESPVHTPIANAKYLQNVFNRSISYRTDSDIFGGYGWTAKKDENLRNASSVPVIAQGKSKLVVWFVSNCGPRERKNYASELAKYVKIDIFGRCGKPDPCKRNRKCVSKMIQTYKFCLAFENSRCRDYITEKYWRQVIAGCLPIVLGPSIDNYNRIVAPDSFLHVDNFTSPEKLASYIKYLDSNDEAYYKYHMWRNRYNIFYRDNKEIKFSLCHFCSVQDAKPHKPYNLTQYWGVENNCNSTLL